MSHIVADESSLALAAERLRQGGLVAFPTETVYGLGADARDAGAVARIFATKGRPTLNPLIVHERSAERAFALATDVPPLARALAETFWPGPLTIVVPRGPSLAALVSAGLPTVALRVPRHPVALQLLAAFDGPLAAPSANRSTQLSPTRAEHVRAAFGDDEVLVLDGGPTECGLESTVVAPTGTTIDVLRLGSVSVEELTAVGTLLGITVRVTADTSSAPRSPGQMLRHYAPNKPLFFVDAANELPEHARTALFGMALGSPKGFQRTADVSPSGDVREAAARFFEALHLLSQDPTIERIVAVAFPERDLGVALNDRLRRAAAATATTE